MKGLDSVFVDMIGSHLLAIAEEMGVVLVRASYSSNVKERRDCSAALLDAEGRTTAQAEHIPLHMGSMLGLVPRILERYGDDVHAGDVFVSNDPYAGGGTHLPDVTMAAPLIADGALRGWAAVVAHHTEIGGALVGAAADVFDEGLRIPPVRLFSCGELDADLFDLIVANCRAREERLGDLRAQVAALRVGARRHAEMCERHSAAVVASATDAWLDKAERQARVALAALPPGRWTFEDWVDGDGVGTRDIRIAVAVERSGDGLVVDFEGSDPQVAGAINVVRSALLATVYYAVKVVLDPDLPANAGYYRLVEVRAPERSVVDAGPPAPVLWRSDTCQRIVDVVLGAFAQLIPERICAAANGAITGVQFSGDHGERGFFSYLETLGGGFGARVRSDGPDAVHAHMTNSSNLPIEALELEYPLRVERYGLRDGSGGVGEHRGGLGIVRELRVLADHVYYRSKGERTARGPWGLLGGGAGAPARFVLNPGRADERTLDSKQAGIRLDRGDVVRVETPGGGGYGDPRRRDQRAHARDVRDGKVLEVQA